MKNLNQMIRKESDIKAVLKSLCLQNEGELG